MANSEINDRLLDYSHRFSDLINIGNGTNSNDKMIEELEKIKKKIDDDIEYCKNIKFINHCKQFATTEKAVDFANSIRFKIQSGGDDGSRSMGGYWISYSKITYDTNMGEIILDIAHSRASEDPNYYEFDLFGNILFEAGNKNYSENGNYLDEIYDIISAAAEYNSQAIREILFIIKEMINNKEINTFYEIGSKQILDHIDDIIKNKL
jgi:hypothetical protein